MARFARVVAVGAAHHVTQRGNGRQLILASDAERLVYLDLLGEAVRLQRLSVVGYCLMSNHVHCVVIPHQAEALGAVFKRVHGRYASYWNVAHASSGHVWQGRFYSCPLDLPHLWEALRYVELNPVRARLASEAAAWPWSSAAAHGGTGPPAPFLDLTMWRKHWSEDAWRRFLAAGEEEAAIAALRRSTHSGRPLGTAAFVRALEKRTQRRLAARPGGRPKKSRRK